MIAAWNYEAANLSMTELGGDFIDEIIFRNNKVNEFLNIERDKRFFIVAPKGFGKTLLLKTKSQIYRNKIKGAIFIPKTQLCERLFDVIPTLGSEYSNLFSKKESWEKIWKLSLMILLIRHCDEDYTFPDEINKTISDAKSLNGILGSLLSQRKSIFKLIELIPTVLLDKIENINKPTYVFIDNIDEAFVKFIKEYRTYDEKSKDIWINTQVGLMTAVRDICDNNSHIKIYAAIQSEAILRPKDSLFLQLKDYCTELDYRRQELKDIFEKNIERMDFHDIKNPKSTNLIERFLGFSVFSHRFAKNFDGTSRIETAFDFIYRHTLGRTREVVMLGAEINHIPIGERSMNNVVEVVNEVSNIILLQYQSEIMGSAEINAYETFCQKAKRNVLTRNELEIITKEVFETCRFEEIDSYLYRIGLLGWTEEKFEDDHMIQKFLPAARYVYDDSRRLPYSNYYIIHSCVDKDLLKYHGKLFYDQGNIIGNGYDFFPKKNKSGNISKFTILYQNGETHLQTGKFDDALSSFEEAINILLDSDTKEDSLLADTYTMIGVSYKGLYTQAKQSKKEFYKLSAIEKFNSAGHIFINLSGQVKEISDRLSFSKRAMMPFNNVIELDEDNLTALEGLLSCAEIEGNSQQMLSLIMRTEKVKREIQYENNLKTKTVITNINITNVSIFSEVKWNVQRNINVLLGRNGFGKTHLLRLISCLLQQNIDILHRDFLQKGNSQTIASIRLLQDGLPVNSTITNAMPSILEDEIVNSDIRRYRSFNLDDLYFKDNPGIIPILAIPDNRYIDKSKNEITRKEILKYGNKSESDFLVHEGAVCFINQISINNFVEDFLYKIGLECFLAKGKDNKKNMEILIRELPLVKLVENVFSLLTDKGFQFFDVESVDTKFSAFKIYVKTEGNPDPIPIQKASQGTLSIIGILGLIYNYLESINKIVNLSNEDIIMANGIVIIEEIDAHLHPSWQQRIIGVLRSSFPNVQYILSSHSPLVVAGCLENEVGVIKKNTESEHFYFEQVDHDFIGWTTSDLYSEEIFGIEEYDDNYLYFANLAENIEQIKEDIRLFYEGKNAAVKELDILQKEKQLHYINKFLRKKEEKNYLTDLILENVKLKSQIKRKNG